MPILDCVCVIHGDRYPWIYVDRLWAMLCRHLSTPPRLHVFTEANRAVPDHMIRHVLEEWPCISGSRRAWWYKMQMFDPKHSLGQVLYLDLDVVICASLDWVTQLDQHYFWAIHDWRRLWRKHWQGVNSSMMYWNNNHFPQIWSEFQKNRLEQLMRQYHGDQDFLSATVGLDRLRYFDHDVVRSWRWQIRDGGMDPRTRVYARPDAGSVVPPGTAVMVFHGTPKPHEIQDNVIPNLWY